MGLLRGVARTAVIAGTATAVSNRVSRRQQQRWAQQEQAESGYPPQGGGDPDGDLAAQLDRLTEMKVRGQLTDEEFKAAKARLLGM